MRSGLSQLAQIESAVSVLCAERGYAGTRLEDVLERAGVGEKEFHAHFTDLEDCFCSVVQGGAEELLARAGAAFVAEEGWCNQLRAAAYTMLDFLREDPVRARVMVVESPLACERSREIREQGMAALAALIDLARAELPDPETVSPATAELTAGAIYNRIHLAIDRDDPSLDEEMVRELMYTAVRPYLGPDAAIAELNARRPSG